MRLRRHLARRGNDRTVRPVMLPFAINHVTVPGLGADALLNLARDLGCVGVELRNDLARPLFDGRDPAEVGAQARDSGLRILGLSQVYPFNAWSDAVRGEVATLIAQARDCGAETISLIPRNDGAGVAGDERRDNARRALEAIRPMLEDAGLMALVEPLGFPRTSSLRDKAETLRLIDDVGGGAVFALVHDTFHHHLAGGGPLFAARTGMVHVSGVTDPGLTVEAMTDAHRVMVGADDVLDNAGQVATLLRAGYAGPVSVEAFSPEVHRMEDPAAALRASMAWLEGAVARAMQRDGLPEGETIR